MPNVSVIVPVYKVEKHLEKCIASILAQTYTDFELILIDDGSPDNCGEICDKFSEIDKRVTVIHKTNSGVSSARNAGIEAARGTYIMFCDADDSVNPEWMEQLVIAAKNHPSKWIVCGFNLYDAGKKKTLNCAESEVFDKTDYFKVYQSGVSAYCWNKIYERKLIEKYRIRFDTAINNGEDVLFNVEYLNCVDGIYFMSAALYNYNLNQNSVSLRYNAMRFEDSRYAYRVRLNLIAPEYLSKYSEMWYWNFGQDIRNVFDSRNAWGIFKKISYCKEIIRSDEFKQCLDRIDTSTFNNLYLFCLRREYFVFIYIYGWLKTYIKKLRRKRS